MKNALEDLVRSTYESLLARHPEYCTCEKCRDDVLALALNQSRPRYTVGDPLGAALTRVALEQDQTRAEVAVVVFDAMRRVAANPRHGTDRISRQVVPPEGAT